MALGDTIYVFDIGLASSDRDVYDSLSLPRVLAYCLEHTEGIALTNGISAPDEPISLGQPLRGGL